MSNADTVSYLAKQTAEQEEKKNSATTEKMAVRRHAVSDGKDMIIKSSTAEFLIFQAEGQEDSIEVRYEDETVWLTQRMMATLFDVTVPTVNEHLKAVFESGELERNATIWKFRIVQREGTRQVSRDIDHYNLGAVINNHTLGGGLLPTWAGGVKELFRRREGCPFSGRAIVRNV